MTTATVHADTFVPTLAQAARAAATKASLPILECVRLQATDGRMIVTGTDLVHGEALPVPATGDLDTVVSAKELHALVKGYKSGALTLANGDGKLTVTTPGGTATLNVWEPDDYPTMPREGSHALTIDAAALRTALPLVSLALAADDSRPVLAHVLIELGHNGLMLAAADGFRLTVYQSHNLPNDAKRQLLIDRKTARELPRILKGYDGPVMIRRNGVGDTIISTDRGELIYSRPEEGTFPDVRQIVRREHATTITVDHDALLATVTRMAAVAKSNNDVIRFELAGDASFMVSANNGDGMNAAESLQAESQGQPMQIAFKAQYLLDFLKATRKMGRVTIHLNGKTQAGNFAVADRPEYTCVIMPMVIGGE